MAFREPPFIRSLEKEAETCDCGVFLTYAGTLVLIIQTDLAFVDLGHLEKSQRSRRSTNSLSVGILHGRFPSSGTHRQRPRFLPHRSVVLSQ